MMMLWSQEHRVHRFGVKVVTLYSFRYYCEPLRQTFGVQSNGYFFHRLVQRLFWRVPEPNAPKK